jgi:hypothetical protein
MRAFDQPLLRDLSCLRGRAWYKRTLCLADADQRSQAAPGRSCSSQPVSRSLRQRVRLARIIHEPVGRHGIARPVPAFEARRPGP